MKEETKHLRITEWTHCHLKYKYFVTVNHTVMTTVYFLYRKLQLTLVLYTFVALMTSCNTRTSDEMMRSNYPEWRSFGSKPVYPYLISCACDMPCSPIWSVIARFEWICWTFQFKLFYQNIREIIINATPN